MLKLAIIADLHLPETFGTVQYDAFEFALSSIKRNSPDCIVSLGDISAYGEIDPAEYFMERMDEINIPKLFIMGNSDIRTKENAEKMKFIETKKILDINGYRLIGLNTSDGSLSTDDKTLLGASDKKTLIFMHHPYEHMKSDSGVFVKGEIEKNRFLALFYGHMHYYERKDNVFSIQALDPDKAIGEPPCITYFNIDDDNITVEFDHFPVKKQIDIEKYIGISCFDPINDLRYCADNNILNCELRPSVLKCPQNEIGDAIEYFRNHGGKYLSLHMPEIGYDGDLVGMDEFGRAIDFVLLHNISQITVHVPKATVSDVYSTGGDIIADYLYHKIKALPDSTVVGIENMHMTKKDTADDSRRFGYTPHECLYFIEKLNHLFDFERVGSVFDIGHARNNAPYSGKYPLGVWYKEMGEKIVSYHIHQVILENGVMDNHREVSSLFGPLISYCGMIHLWNENKINRKPFFLEIRGGKDKYIRSLKTFLGDQ